MKRDVVYRMAYYLGFKTSEVIFVCQTVMQHLRVFIIRVLSTCAFVSEVTTTNMFIIIIVFYTPGSKDPRGKNYNS